MIEAKAITEAKQPEVSQNWPHNWGQASRSNIRGP